MTMTETTGEELLDRLKFRGGEREVARRLLRGDRVTLRQLRDLGISTHLAHTAARLQAGGIQMGRAELPREPGATRSQVEYWVLAPDETSPLPIGEPRARQGKKRAAKKTRNRKKEPAGTTTPVTTPVPGFGTDLKVVGLLEEKGRTIVHLRNGKGTFVAEVVAYLTK